jgi:hypothetical protein
MIGAFSRVMVKHRTAIIGVLQHLGRLMLGRLGVRYLADLEVRFSLLRAVFILAQVAIMMFWLVLQNAQWDSMFPVKNFSARMVLSEEIPTIIMMRFQQAVGKMESNQPRINSIQS